MQWSQCNQHVHIFLFKHTLYTITKTPTQHACCGATLLQHRHNIVCSPVQCALHAIRDDNVWQHSWCSSTTGNMMYIHHLFFLSVCKCTFQYVKRQEVKVVWFSVELCDMFACHIWTCSTCKSVNKMIYTGAIFVRSTHSVECCALEKRSDSITKHNTKNKTIKIWNCRKASALPARRSSSTNQIDKHIRRT